MINRGREVVLSVINRNLSAGHRVTRILSVLSIPTSTYYYYLKWQPSKMAVRRQKIKEKILECWKQYPMYGYPRLTMLLNNQFDFCVSSRLVYHLMKELGIKSKMIKKERKPTTKTEYPQRPNLIKDLDDKSGVLLTDITYIPVNNKWVYLASLYDPESRKVLSHRLSESMTKELATSVIKEPIINKRHTRIIHSDMGSQYTSDLFEETLLKQGLKHSYSRKGRPGDNARIESFHSLLKREYVNHQSFKSIDEAIAGIDWYIRFYNNERISFVA